MNIPTAEEWLTNHKEFSEYSLEEYDEGGYLGINTEILYEIMIEFTRLHCIEQARIILEKRLDEGANFDPNSILDAYDLNNIK